MFTKEFIVLLKGEKHFVRSLDLYWKTNPDWYDYTDDEDPDAKPFLTDKAPPEAVESFKRYLEQKKEMKK